MKVIKRLAVLYKTLILLTGFCVLMMGLPGRVLAQYPSASFTSNVFTGCAPLSVDFTNLSTQATNYYWDFGNGNFSTLTDPSTVYITSGFYTVTLVAINNLTGNRDTLVATNYINVTPDPVADFTATPLSGCAGNNNIVFTNLSLNSNSYTWDFGDGTFSVQSNPVHNYANAGVYTVKLIARNAYGCNKIKIRNSYITIYSNPPAAFIVSQQSSCNVNQVFNFSCTTPGVTGWLWNFGDGTTAIVQNPNHVYGAQGSFNVSLIVYNTFGCSDTIVNPNFINIGASLVPTFTVNSQTGCAPFTADFTSTIPNATSWAWNFGDGGISSLGNPSHIYASPGSYQVTLTVTTGVGCNGTVVIPGYITVDPLPVPSFTVNDQSGCVPHTTFFTNTSVNGVTWLWDFGDGSTSTDSMPFHTYADTGIYTVSLTAYSANGCQAIYTMPAAVTVENITANFSGTPRAGCAPLPVAFTGTTTPSGVTWNWNFGDGATGTGQNSSHTYNAIGDYTVSLIVTSASGCIDTITKTNYIRVFDDSTAYTVPDTIQVCLPPGTVSFTDPTMGSNSWLWDFGDGTTATIKNPTHTYSVPGIYTVTLIANMAGGCTQTFNPYAIIEVIPFLASPITSLVLSPCAPFTVQLNNLTLNVASYLWDFGDGTTSTLQNPVHVYALPGTYTISLLLTSVNGCQTSLTTTVTFGYTNPILVSDTTTCLGDVIQFNLNPIASFNSATWNFGDGTTSTQLAPTHMYANTGTYTISVLVTDINGCVYNYVYPYQVYVSNPVSSFTTNQSTSGCVPYTVQFVNNSTGASGYYWYFGDGTNATQANPSHTYTTPGVYTVTLNAAKKGCVRVSTITNYITVNQATANFTFTPDSGCNPLTATFTDQSVNAVSWLWNFGDGTTSALQNPVHIFNSVPDSIVSLIITDNNGCRDTVTNPNVVFQTPDLQVSDTTGCNPSAIAFTTSLNALSYLWDFGDGTTSNQQNPVHNYSQSGLFSVSLNCTMASGCLATTSNPGLISISSPVSDFMSPTVAICAPSLVNFVNQSSGATSWLWNFGDGTTSVTQNPSHIYNIPGSYTVSLISYSSLGCSDTIIRVNYITVPGTYTDFVLSGTQFCANSVVQFTDQSINGTNYLWNFGDGATSTLQNPSHVYTGSGSYTVTLITTDSVGCASFFSYPSPITINPNPQAAANVTPAIGCLPLTSTFTNTSSGSDAYTWYFGNGDSSTTPDTVYTYTIPGIYYPYLVTATNFGCTDTFNYSAGVSVSGLPVPDFTINVISNCVPAQINFLDNSTVTLNPTYSWDFGNGQTSNQQNPVVTFYTSGTFQVTLIVINAGGCADTIVKPVTLLDSPLAIASVSGNSGCAPYIASFTNTSSNATSYSWNFGDGTTSAATSPSHTYAVPGNYTVTLIAINTNGCVDTLVFPNSIQVNQSPVAGFTRTPASGCSPLSVTFTSNSGQLNNPAYIWDFGNGQNGNLNTHTIIYSAAGTYTATLIVTNSNGCSDTINRNEIVNQSPQAIASASGYNGCAPYTVSFTNSSLNATSYSWDFGDGSTSIQASPSHIYSVAGDYIVTLFAAAAAGCSDTLVFTNQIHVNLTPIAGISASALSACTPVAVIFNDQSTSLDSAVYSWDFGNGQNSSAAQATIAYSTGGTYSVSLIVTNQGGCSDTSGTVITIYDTAVAAATVNDTSGCTPFIATFVNNSTNGSSYNWNFGDGTFSTQMNPVHTYLTAGNYNVTLIVLGAGGCADTLILPETIYVKATPAAAFNPLSISGCNPMIVNFTNTSANLSGATYLWDFGNGNQSSATQPSYTYLQPGFFAVSLIVTNSGGCSDTAYASVTSNLTPVASGILSDTSGCMPYPVTFTNTTASASGILWNFGDGTTSSSDTIQHIYNASGTYYPYLVASGSAGCSDTLFFNTPIVIQQNPSASFSVSQASNCPGSQIQFINQSTPVSGLTYQWNIAGINYTAATPSVVLSNPGFYDVTLVAINQFGCSDTLVQANYLQVYDTVPPVVSPILSVSVVDNASVEIIWQNNSALDLGAYILYRYNTVSGAFDEIFRDSTPGNSTMNITSSYINNGLNTLTNVYTYKLKTTDQCAYTLPMSSLTAHTTINITALPSGNDIRVTWTGYYGCPVSSYELNRVNLATGATALIATLPPGTLTYLDQGFDCPEEYSYRVMATDLCGNTYTSFSDTSNVTPENVLRDQKVDVVRSTVINDHDVLTEWLAPVIAPNRVVQYTVMRSEDNINFTEIATVPSTVYSYIDYNASVHEKEYYYRVDVINDCSIAGTQGYNSSSILLKSNWLDEKTRLWWTPYNKWDSGVDYYVIEKENNSGQWIPLKTVDGNILNTDIDE